jgi:hypothetical protein
MERDQQFYKPSAVKYYLWTTKNAE